MAKVKHRIRRDGGIKIRDTWYELDATGCVDVPEEHAAILLQGAMWTRLGPAPMPALPPVLDRSSAPPPAPPPVPTPDLPPAPPPVNDEDLAAMDRGELLVLAKKMGIEVDGRWGRLKLATVIRRARKRVET